VFSTKKNNEIISLVTNDNRLSVRNIALAPGVSKSTAYKALKLSNFRSYHFQNTQELHPGD